MAQVSKDVPPLSLCTTWPAFNVFYLRRSWEFFRYHCFPEQGPTFHHHGETQNFTCVGRDSEAGRTTEICQAVEEGEEEGKGKEGFAEL